MADESLINEMYQDSKRILENDGFKAIPSRGDIIELTKVFMTLYCIDRICDNLNDIAREIEFK